MTIFYHFTKDTLRDGSPIPPIGEWLHFEGEPIICERGLHASRHVADALDYAPGCLLHKVELEGIADEQDDKVVAWSRKIVATIDATEVIRHYARLCALDVIHLWDAPDIVRLYLETGNEDLHETAQAAAAWEAAWATWPAWATQEAAQAAAWATWPAWATQEAAAARAAVAAQAAAAAQAEAQAADLREKQRARLLEMVEAEFTRMAK